ncbi:MAG: putative CRISPR-associated protein [Oscillatoria sp. SIO1A7]|nr:putative CRISPR-associated protein [Oscillatoria sp. SIO1A7]
MRNTLICTVRTSLLYPNLKGLPSPETYESWLARQPEQDREYLLPEAIENLKAAFENENYGHLAEILGSLPGNVRLCGAEINSIADIIKRKYCTERCNLIFCHSATEDGRRIAEILESYYKIKGHIVEKQEIEHLQDNEPKLFRTKGLRNLAKTISKIVRERSAQFSAINATGGYKAQIAIGVLMGQALEVPVYYKHERFSEIIAFPPMPIALDFDLWMENSGWLSALEREEMVIAKDVESGWREQLETLVERVDINGEGYLELSPTGQIFHDTFKNRFQSNRDRILPPPVPKQQKKAPQLTDHNWRNARTAIIDFMQKVVDEYPYVRTCRTDYWNEHLSLPVQFRLKGEQIEGIFSNGTWTVKFIVETSATTGAFQFCALPQQRL